MKEPLDYAIGNNIEVMEAIEILKGKGPSDLIDVSKALAVELLLISRIVETKEAALKLINNVIENGSALEKFREMIAFQGGAMVRLLMILVFSQKAKIHFLLHLKLKAM